MKEMTFIQAMKDFFGLLPGKSLQDFMAEVKALPERASWIAGLEANGYVITNKDQQATTS